MFYASVKRSNGELRGITSIVRRGAGGALASMFEEIAAGDEDRGTGSYELLDAVDLDGDGLAELGVTFHNYEFHEFQILRRAGSKYEVAHKGPSFGC